MKAWPKRKIGLMLSRVKDDVQIDDFTTYSRITIRMAGKGINLRDRAIGSEIGTKHQFIARSGQFVLSKIDARNGAFGVLPDECDNAIVTGNFWVFDVDHARLNSHFFNYLSKSPEFVAACVVASDGTTNRRYLQEEAFLDMEIPVPSLSEQQAIVDHLDALAEKTRQVEAHLAAVERDAERLVRTYLLHPPGEQPTKRRMAELVYQRPPDVTVDGAACYRFAGVYSFGRGVFPSAVKAGSEFAYERLSTVRAGDFIYPKLMAWEGALGVVPPECDGMVVSPEFPVFSINTEEVLPELLDIYFRTPEVWPALAELSGGTNLRRRRLQPSAFLNYEMPIPSMATQLKIRRMHQSTRALKARHAAIRAANAALLPATLERLFSSCIPDKEMQPCC